MQRLNIEYLLGTKSPASRVEKEGGWCSSRDQLNCPQVTAVPKCQSFNRTQVYFLLR